MSCYFSEPYCTLNLPPFRQRKELYLVNDLCPLLTGGGMALYNVTHEYTRSPYSFIPKGGNASAKALGESAGS